MLSRGPTGSRIHPKTGVFTWTAAGTPGQTFPFEVAAVSGQGRRITYRTVLRIVPTAELRVWKGLLGRPGRECQPWPGWRKTPVDVDGDGVKDAVWRTVCVEEHQHPRNPGAGWTRERQVIVLRKKNPDGSNRPVLLRLRYDLHAHHPPGNRLVVDKAPGGVALLRFDLWNGGVPNTYSYTRVDGDTIIGVGNVHGADMGKPPRVQRNARGEITTLWEWGAVDPERDEPGHKPRKARRRVWKNGAFR